MLIPSTILTLSPELAAVWLVFIHFCVECGKEEVLEDSFVICTLISIVVIENMLQFRVVK